MISLHRLALPLLTLAVGFALAACSATRHQDTVHTSGTPVNPFTDPGSADLPSAPLTGAQPQHR